MSQRITQEILDHVSTFQLVSNHDTWLDSYETLREVNSNPALDKIDKAHAILQSTFEALAAAKQLRIKRFLGYTGLGYDRKWYNEIQILDKYNQVVETIIGFAYDLDLPKIEILLYYMHNPVLYREDELILLNEILTRTLIILPMEFPDYPEFRDENGNPFELSFNDQSDGSFFHNNVFYDFDIVMDKEFITEEIVTEKMRNEKVRLYTIEQCKKMKEELMINRWHPSRVEKLLLAGYDIEDI